ncbi:MAG: transposase [Alphaproteobacteria bacterium]|nr:transposase [Alphaproteobacteria bacterium]
MPPALSDGGTGLEQAYPPSGATCRSQRCTVHKHRNLLADAPQCLDEEVSAETTIMIYAASAAEIERRRRAFRSGGFRTRAYPPSTLLYRPTPGPRRRSSRGSGTKGGSTARSRGASRSGVGLYGFAGGRRAALSVFRAVAV